MSVRCKRLDLSPLDVLLHSSAPLRGTLTLPPDKAICHRAVLAAALAAGTTRIHPWPSADDCQRTLQLVQQLGAAVRVSVDEATIDGRGTAGLAAPRHALLCGESGTTLRLAAGVLAGQPFLSRLAAGPSLSRRPMRRIVEPLTRMGARITGRTLPAAGQAGAEEASEVCPPLTIEGRRPLAGMTYELPVASAQVASAILFAGLFASGETTVIEPAVLRDHTERMLAAFGASVRRDGRRVSIQPGALTSPGDIALPGDISSAAFFVVAASCVPGSRVTLEDSGLNPTRLGFLEVLKRMGAAVRLTPSEGRGEPRGSIQVEARALRAATVQPHEAPGLIDELPILMVAAACAQGVSRFLGLGELRVKETDRVASMAEGLRRLGADVRLPAPDTVEIAGGVLHGALVESAGDHRTAMSLAVAGLAAGGSTRVAGAECVAKSYPEFFSHLQRLAGSSTVKTIDTVSRVG